MIELDLDSSTKDCLPSDFMHGYSSASYQIEGGFKQDGRGLSVWDDVLRDAPLGNGDVACDSYNLWKDDVRLLQQYGANTYRFSISWSRIIPLGGRNDPINPKGLAYYSNLIDALLNAGITPFITLFHWDTPLALEQRYGGFNATGHHKEELMQDWERYAALVFGTFGDRVKHWITHNEPQSYAILNARVLKKDDFDIEVDRWVLGNNLILTHARAVALYRRDFQHRQRGIIGITLDIEWVEPLFDTPEARSAAEQSVDILAGWFADPIYLGKHNETIKKFANGNLPDFTAEEWKLVKGSYDFFGVNHYSTKWATGVVRQGLTPDERYHGEFEHVTQDQQGKPIGRRGHNGHPYDVPWGFRKLLNDIRRRWMGPRSVPIYITENGFAGDHEGDRSLAEIVNDEDRQEYFRGHLEAMAQAVKEDGIDIAGYFGWSLLDNLEWSMGYAPRFGVTHVNRDDGCKRTPKDSTVVVKAIFEHLVASQE